MNTYRHYLQHVLKWPQALAGVNGCTCRLILKVLQSSESSATSWQMPLCGVYLLMFIKSGVFDFTIGMIMKVMHFNGENSHFAHFA